MKWPKRFLALFLVLSLCFLLGGCGGGGGGGVEPESFILADNVVLLGDVDSLSEVEVNSLDLTGVFVFNTLEEESRLQVGEIINIGVTEKTPYGFLGKIEEKKVEGETITLKTRAAALSEAIEEGHLKLENINLADYANEATINNANAQSRLQVSIVEKEVPNANFKNGFDNEFVIKKCFHVGMDHAFPDHEHPVCETSGGIEACIMIDVDIEIKHFSIQHAHFIMKPSIEGQIGAEFPLCSSSIFEYERELLNIHLLPIRIPTPVPGFFVTIRPIVHFYVNITGEIKASVSLGATANISCTAGAEYDGEKWSGIWKRETEFKTIPPNVSAKLTAKVSLVNPEVAFYFFGLAGPHVGLDVYTSASVDPFKTPWWEVRCGLDALAGGKLRFLKYDLGELEIKVGGYSVITGQAEPVITITPAPITPVPITPAPITPAPITPAPSLGITYGNFAVTKLAYEDDSDWDQTIQEIFGSKYRVADWNDLKSFYADGGDLLDLFDGLGLAKDENPTVFVTRNGDPSYSATRFYFATRHEHEKPSSYLAHDNIDNYLISLGSWYGSQEIMAVKKSFDEN